MRPSPCPGSLQGHVRDAQSHRRLRECGRRLAKMEKSSGLGFMERPPFYSGEGKMEKVSRKGGDRGKEKTQCEL